MSACQSCGGVIGRDCWNPQECSEITASMAYQPQAREEAQPGEPVGWDRVHGFDMPVARYGPLPTPPAPEAEKLRVAIEALEPFARLQLPPHKSVGNAGAYSILFNDIRRAAEALAALQQKDRPDA